MQQLVALAAASLAAVAASVAAQTVVPPFNAAFTVVDLGPVPGRHAYGGIAFRPGASDTLLYGEFASGQIVAVPLRRDAQHRIAGFGAPTPFAAVGGPDGGLAVGPGGVLFATVYGPHTLEQLRSGSTTVDRVIDLGALGIPGSVGSCAFAPPGHPAAGRLKVLSFGSGAWSDCRLAADGNGTWSIVQVGAPIPIAGGPEGALYPPAGLPLLPDLATVLVAEWSTGEVAVYDTDGHGDPLPATRRTFAANLFGCAGGAVDPVTGDMLFTFGPGHVAAIRNIGSPCGTFTGYGTGTAGFRGAPSLVGSGCARLGQSVSIAVAGGRPGAVCALNVGTWPTDVTAVGVRVLTFPDVVVPLRLDTTGAATLGLALPGDPTVAAVDVFFQAIVLDPAAVQGVSATAGLRMDVR